METVEDSITILALAQMIAVYVIFVWGLYALILAVVVLAVTVVNKKK